MAQGQSVVPAPNVSLGIRTSPFQFRVYLRQSWRVTQNYLRITRILRCLSPELTYEGMPVANGQDARLAWESLLRDTRGIQIKAPITTGQIQHKHSRVSGFEFLGCVVL